jgi:UDP-glucose 4-epimerase
MSTTLITGGCGFIGSHLVHSLLQDGHDVRVLDDLSTGKRENLPAGAELPPGAELIVGDIADPAAVAEAVRGIDGCFHLAAIASVERGVRDWRGTHRANLTGTITLLDAIRAHPVPFVYASSAAVYGDCDALPITEAERPRPLSAYGADKLGCELHARVATGVHGIPTVGLRFFNVYGPRQDPASPYSGVISIFCNRLRRRQPVDVFGDGLQVRDFVYVADVVAALRAAMALHPDGAPVFNVCTGIATSVRDLAHAIAGICGSVPELRPQPPRAGEIRASLGSPARLREVLRTADPVPLREGLRATLQWMAE